MSILAKIPIEILNPLSRLSARTSPEAPPSDHFLSKRAIRGVQGHSYAGCPPLSQRRHPRALWQITAATSGQDSRRPKISSRQLIFENYGLSREQISICQKLFKAETDNITARARARELKLTREGRNRERHAAARELQAAERELQAAERELQVAAREKNLTVKLADTENESKQRFQRIAELRGFSHLREFLKELQNEKGFVETTSRGNPSQMDKWTAIFAGSVDLQACAQRIYGAKTPAKSAQEMVRIIGTLDKQMHRSDERTDVQKTGGVIVNESLVLGSEDCYLIECVFRHFNVPHEIVWEQRGQQPANANRPNDEAHGSKDA